MKTIKPLISLSEAKQLLTRDGCSIKLLGVVSDYYNDSLLQQYHTTKPSSGFAIVKTEDLEIDQVWTLKPDTALKKVLTSAGLTLDTNQAILLFDNIQFSCGKNTTRFDASARLLAVLRFFGFTKVSIIFDNKVGSHFKDLVDLQRAKHQPFERLSGCASILARNKNTFVKYDELARLLKGELGPYHLLDARSKEEFSGLNTGYDYVPLAGKIPNALNIINGDYQLSTNENLSSVLSRLQSVLDEKNILKDDRIIWYCGTAWRASRMYCLSLALGYRQVSIYDGGWNEWQRFHPEDGSPCLSNCSNR